MRGVKTKAQSRWRQLPIFLLLLLVLGLLANSVTKVYQKKKGAEELLARMKVEKQELEERQIELENSLERIKTEEGLKFELRKKLNVAEVGESVAIIVEDEIPAPENPSDSSIWQKFKSWFGGWFE